MINQTKVGLIGFGVIGNYLYYKSKEESSFNVEFIFEVDPKKTENISNTSLLTDFKNFEKFSVDLVVEAATPQVIREYAPRILKRSHLFVSSVTALAGSHLRQKLETIAKASNTTIYISPGAIVGLDGIFNGRDVINSVEIITTKHPENLQGNHDLNMSEPTVVYEGSTRGACDKYPRNVNVHASIALAGIGFDKTQSKIIADPNTSKMSHLIIVNGEGFIWEMNIQSQAVGKVSGAFTPNSIYQSIKRICSDNRIIKIT